MVLRSLLALLALTLTTSAWCQTDPCGTVTLAGPDRLQICLGDAITLQQTNSLAGATVTFSSASGFIPLTVDPSPTLRPTASGFIRVTASLPGLCTVSDSVFVDVDRLVAPSLIADGSFCQDEPINLLAERITDTGNSNYLLLGGEDTIRSGRDPNFTVSLFRDSVFTLISRSDNGACEDRQTVSLRVIPGTFEIPQDTLFACLGSGPLTLSVNTSAASQDIRWSPSRFNLSRPDSGSFVVQPTADITYFARATVNGCERIDSVAVRLDSLPQDVSMVLDPEKDPYCQGDTFYVVSPIFDAGDFPVIDHDWIEAPGLQSPRDLYNAVFVAEDTATLTRVTTNGACVDTTSIDVNVVTPPEVTFSPVDPVVCPGDTLRITATFVTGAGTLSWEDPLGTLSCNDCLDPVALVDTDTEYTITVETEASDCTSELMYAIRTRPAISPRLTDALQLCPGDSRQLIIDQIVPTYTYRITGGGVDSADPTLLVTPSETTTYTVETTSDCGVDTQTVTLVVLADYTVTATAPDAVCAGTPLTLSAATDPTGLAGTYTWTLPNGVSRTGQSITVDEALVGQYTVTFTDAAGCSSATDAVSVSVIAADLRPRITATGPDGAPIFSGGTVFSGNTVQLGVDLPDDLDYTFEWSGNYQPPSATTRDLAVFIPRTEGDERPATLSYQVTVTTVDGGCPFEASIVINVEQSRVQAPDFFTPDNDGRNDRFRLFYNGTVTDYTLIVYDRWGQKVFTSDDPMEGWDGTKNGTPQTADTYLYLAKFRQDGVELQREGQFTLLR